MKRYILSLAAVAAMVGCAKDAPIVDNTNNEPVERLSIAASIDLSDTRVTIGGEKFTDVKWERGDVVRLASVAGINTELMTTESGDTDVIFRGDGDYLADEDTYYAIYPSTAIKSGAATFNLAAQDGKDVAILAAKSENAMKGVIDMAFKPINALLHVAVADAPEIAKAEFLAYDASEFAAAFSYNFAEDKVTTTAMATVLTVNNPNAEDFFFSLPADLDMSGGYIVRLTDERGNVCSKAYNGKVFARGTTTRVEFAWSQPTVTLGTPMTSYSYYVAGNVSQANNCAHNIIYFPTASSYANVQNAMVTEAGVIVDGVSYKAEVANKSFTPASVTVSSWGEKRVVAYIKTRDGKTIQSASQTVYITGLPHNNHWFSSDDTTGWETTGTVSFDSGYGYRTMYYYLGGVDGGAIFSPSFSLPANVNVHYDIKACYYTTGLFAKSIKLITGITSGTSVPSSTQTKELTRVTSNANPSEGKYTTCSFDAVMGNGQRIYITDDHQKDGNAAQNWFTIGSCAIKYR